MTTIGFPKMFTNSNTLVVRDSHKATMQNLKLLLSSEKGEFFGDPYYGIKLKAYMFNQNNYVLRDILIDEIYSQIQLFMPQLVVMRNDIVITSTRGKATVRIKALNREDFQTNMYDLVLFDTEEK